MTAGGKNPWSLFPAAEAAKAKVSVSVLLLIAVAYGAYHLGSQRHADQIAALKAEVSDLKRSQDGLCRTSRMEELMNNVARDQAAMHGRIMQINADTQVLLSKTK